MRRISKMIFVKYDSTMLVDILIPLGGRLTKLMLLLKFKTFVS